MALKNKYQREKQQYSNDSGRTWIDVSPANYRRGRLIEAGSEDCNTVEWKEVTGSWFCIGFNETQYRWVTVSDEYVCVGYDKYEKLKKQESIDGVNWTDVVPLETQTGSLIEANSTDCGYVPPTPGDYENQYLTIESLENNNNITFKRSTSSSDLQRTIYVSTDNGANWTTKSSKYSTPTVLATLNTGDKLLIKGKNKSYGGDYSEGNIISSTNKINVYGNIMSLVYGDDFIGKTEIMAYYAFAKMFSGNPYLISAENLVLPSTTLAKDCYSHMFNGCTGLTSAPVLPATTLASECYYCMFDGCTSLVKAPELPATTLAEGCYWYMFGGCTSLTSAPELPATTLVDDCYPFMFSGCTSITTAPVLPATTLTERCYEGMFSGCTSLVNAPELPVTTLSVSCYSYMFESCTSLVNAPVLPATTLADDCYSHMFSGCTSLNYIKCLATNISATNCTYNWVYKVANTGTFIKDASMTSWTTGDNGIPRGWTVVTE